jgi:hypothetical protein
MMRARLASTLVLFVPLAICQAPSLIVDGGNGKSVTLSRADLAAMPQHTAKAAEHGATATFDGVLLRDLLAKVDTPAGEKLCGKAMTLYVLAEAADGYRAVFALPEVDAGFTDRVVLLATQRDGKPLAAKEGPFRIVVPDEKRPARWVRQVTALRIRQAN